MADSPLGSSDGFLLFNLEIRWVLILMNADMAINLALESKDAINCELIRTIHKAPELTSLFFSFFLKCSWIQAKRKKVFVFLTVTAGLQGDPRGGQGG